jgi:hypothetical protein
MQKVEHIGHNWIYGLHTILDTIVPKGWHTIVAPLVQFGCAFLLLTCYHEDKQNCQLLVLLRLAERGQCPHEYGRANVTFIWFAL